MFDFTRILQGFYYTNDQYIISERLPKFSVAL